MANLEINCIKINEILSSFITQEPIIKEKISQSIACEYDFMCSPHTSTNQKSRIITDRIPVRNTESGKKKTLPNNEYDFKERLSTFEPGLMTSIDVSPLLCASYGWHLIKRDLLKCSTCKAVLCSSLPSPNNYEAYQKFLCLLKKRLSTGHKEWCGWPSNPCPLEFVQPPISSTVHYLKNLKHNSLILCSLNDRLPYIGRRELLTRLDLEENHVSLFYGNDRKSNCVEITAAILVLFGWNFDSSSKLKCNLCLRSVGLWRYVSLAQEEEFLKLKENYNLREEKRRQKAIKRNEKEQRRKVKEEKKLAVIERKKKALEAEEKAIEESKKVQEAIDKISRLEESGLFSDIEDNRVEVTEGEEKSLLEEELEYESLSQKSGCSNGNEAVEQTLQQIKDSSTELDGQNASVSEVRSNVEEDESSDESFDLQQKDDDDEALETVEPNSADNLSHCSTEEYKQNIDTNSESEGGRNSGEETFSEERCDEEDELWLEAVGGFNEDKNQGNSSCDESAAESEKGDIDNDSYDSSSCDGREANRKRSRSSDEESTSEVEETSAKKAKLDDESLLQDGTEAIHSSEATVDDRVITDPGEVCPSGLETNKENEVVDDGMESINLFDLNAVNIENGFMVTPLEEKNMSDEKGTEGEEELSSESDVSEDEDADEEEKRLHELENSLFDPVGEHRHWCGWVTKCVHNESGEHGTVLGYNILPPQLRKILLGFSSPNLASSVKYARNIEGLRAVRNILDSWAVHEEAEEMDI